MRRWLMFVLAFALTPFAAFGGGDASLKEALVWFHSLPKMGGGVNKGLDPERFKKLTLDDLKTLKEIVLGGHPYLDNGKLGGHLKLNDADYRHLAALPALEKLKFPENDLGDEALLHLGKIKTLKSLQLMENKFTADGLKHLAGLKQLTNLDLRWNQDLDDAAVAPLTQLTGLRELNVFKTKITPEGVKRLEQALPQCKVIVTKK